MINPEENEPPVGLEQQVIASFISEGNDNMKLPTLISDLEKFVQAIDDVQANLF